jgi:aspartate/methionine/tyrosine aminotransferase
MTGWRVGFAANPKLAPFFSQWMTNTDSCPVHFNQYATIEALTGPQDKPNKFYKSFKKRRNLIVKLLNKIDGVKCLMPGGAFYVFPNVNGALEKLNLKSAEDLRKVLLDNGVAVLADIHFGKKDPNETNQYIRLSYATSKENIIKGLEIMKKVIEG